MPNTYDLSRYQSARQVMDRILRDCGLNNTNEVDNEELWITWIFEAQLEMKIPVALQETSATVEIKNCIAPKPRGFVVLKHAEIIDETGCKVIPYYRRPSRFLVDSSCPNIIHNYYNEFYEIDNTPLYFHTSSNANGKHLYMRYMEYGFDEDGYPLVDISFYQPVLWYCKWKWIGRSRQMALREYSESQEEQARRQWHYYSRRSYAMEGMANLTPDMLDQIMARYNDTFYRSENRYTAENKQLDLLNTYQGLTSLAILTDTEI